MVLEKLRKRFQPEPLETTVREAHDTFREEREQQIATAKERADGFREDAEDALAGLREHLDDLEGYEDVEGRQVIEDVVDNVVSNRKRLVREFEAPNDPGSLKQELDRFIETFRTMKRKENEVLKVIGDDKKPVFDALERVEAVRDDLASFVNGPHRSLERARTLEELTDRMQELEEEREELEHKIEAVDLTSAREDIQEAQAELDRLHEGEEWGDYERLKERLEEAREEQTAVRNGIEKQANRMERGLKKLLYETAVEHRAVLEDIRDGDIQALLGRDPEAVEKAVTSAADALPSDMLGERQKEKFQDAASKLGQFGERVARLEELGETVTELEEEVATHPAPGWEDEFAAQLDELQETLRKKRKERRSLRDRKEEVEQGMEMVRDRIAEEMDEAFEREVVLS